MVIVWWGRRAKTKSDCQSSKLPFRRLIMPYRPAMRRGGRDKMEGVKADETEYLASGGPPPIGAQGERGTDSR